MRIAYAARGRRSSLHVSASPFGWMVIMPVMLMGWMFKISVITSIWTVKAVIWFYAVPLQLAWRGFQTARKRRRAAQRMAH